MARPTIRTRRQAVVRVCSVRPRMGATVSENVSTASNWIRRAAEPDADLAVFPEMMLTGYDAHLHDLFGQDDWYASVEEGLERLAGVVETSDTATLVGSPWPQGDGFLNVILWPGVATCKTDDDGRITRDGCAECATDIVDRFGVPVIQSSYAAQVTNVPHGRLLGGMVACDAQRTVIARAPYSEESMLSFDVKRTDRAIEVCRAPADRRS